LVAERDQVFPNRENVRKESRKMRHYETIFIVNPTLAEETCREVIDRYKNVIEKQKGVIVKVDEWGQQRLAYRVKKFDKGFYVLLNYCAGSGATSELERELKLDDRILKYQTVKLADDVDPEELILKEKESRKEPEKKEVQDAQVQHETVQATGEQPAEEVKSNV
jgi:small subunit ribosomal protein S6